MLWWRITSVKEAVDIISLVEKIALSHSALTNINLCKEIGDVIGKQSVIVVIDVKKKKLLGVIIFLLIMELKRVIGG